MSSTNSPELAPPVEPGMRVNLNYQLLRKMAHSPIYNYALPGLTSWLIGERSRGGCVRLFQSDREQYEAITPHSHRFDFDCVVLEGEVINHTWSVSPVPNIGDTYLASELVYGDEPGKYKEVIVGRTPQHWLRASQMYRRGECYGARHSAIHSIQFSRGARVLFFEGPQVANRSTILEPWCNGRLVPTFGTLPWMFRQDDS